MSERGASEAVAAPRRPRRRTPGWLREPLLHFVVLGGLLFALDHFAVGNADDPRTIVVGPDVDREARETFKAARGREPSTEELAALHRVWLDNEVLYREASRSSSMGRSGDPRAQIFKRSAWSTRARSCHRSTKRCSAIGSSATASATTSQPVSIFRKPCSRATAPRVATGVRGRLNAGNPGDAEASLRVQGRPRDNPCRASTRVRDRARSSPPRECLQRSGAHVIRLDATTPAHAAEFEDLSGVVLQDWTDATLADQRTAAVRALAKKYTIKAEPAAPGVSFVGPDPRGPAEDADE
jgi:hypothetical protein